MDWYYAIGSDRKGPVNEAEFQRLAQQGVITATTLVWREGMTAWQPHGDQAPPVLTDGAVICAACGRPVPESESFALAEKPYCATCKPLILQRLQDGLPLTNFRAEEIRKEHLSHEASVRSV